MMSDSPNPPYTPPRTEAEIEGKLSADQWRQARAKARWPAIAMLVLVVPGLGWSIASLSFRRNVDPSKVPIELTDPQLKKTVQVVAPIAHYGGFAIDIAAILTQMFMVYGAVCMLRLRSRPIARAAAIAACVPCISSVICLGIPAGVWALFALHHPLVRQAFQSRAS